MFFIKCIQEGYRKALTFDGVTDRKNYFFFFLFHWIVIYLSAMTVALSFGHFIMKSSDQASLATNIAAVIGGLVSVAICLYSWLAGLAISVRRLHDVGLGGWVLIVPYLVMIVGPAVAVNAGQILFIVLDVLLVLVLFLAKSKKEKNKYRPVESDAR